MTKVKALFAVAILTTVFNFVAPTYTSANGGATTNILHGCPECL
ncbi:hypothetical protein [Bacillus coahuilensis]|nr:hypothetical protein [Bacillus coahuilensis]